GGLPEAVGRAPDGGVPGILVPPEDPAAIAAELRGWFGEPDVRRRQKAAARGRRAALGGWASTAQSLAGVLRRLPAEPRRTAGPSRRQPRTPGRSRPSPDPGRPRTRPKAHEGAP